MRPLNEREQAMVRFLASDGRPRAADVLGFLPHLRVSSECGCGCDTVDLADVRGSADRQQQDEFAEAVDETSGLYVHMLIDDDTARPTALEVYGSDHARFPLTDRLRLLPRDGEE